VRRTVHVEQDVSADGLGRVRLRERLTATVEDADGTVTEILQVTVEDRSENTPWFSTGTRRTVTRRTKKVP
jgi:hypothetical protein